jgi:hypothetical protein
MGDGTAGLGRMLLVAGLVLAGVGLFLALGGRVPGLGRLPGDIVWRRGNATFYFPIVTCLLLSLVLSLVLSLFRR